VGEEARRVTGRSGDADKRRLTPIRTEGNTEICFAPIGVHLRSSALIGVYLRQIPVFDF
jgi:hypothetical protein